MRRLSLMLGSVLKYGQLTGAHDVYKYYYFGALHFDSLLYYNQY